MSEQNNFWPQAKAVLAELDLLKHPFYQAWTCGELSKEDLRVYAGEYYHQVAAFPRISPRSIRACPTVACAGRFWPMPRMKNCGEPRTPSFGCNLQRRLARTKCDRAFHRLRWQKLSGSSGSLRRRGRPLKALAAFWAYESQVPRVAKEKAAGLRDRYGLGDEACEYFDLHTTVDEYHSQVWENEINACLTQGASAEDALDGIRIAARELWKALDYVESARCGSERQ